MPDINQEPLLEREGAQPSGSSEVQDRAELLKKLNPPPDTADRFGDHSHRTRMWGSLGRGALLASVVVPSAAGIGYLAWIGIIRKSKMNEAPVVPIAQLSDVALKKSPISVLSPTKEVETPRYIRVAGWAVVGAETTELYTNRNRVVQQLKVTQYQLRATQDELALNDLKTPTLTFLVKRPESDYERPFEALPRALGEVRGVVLTLANRPNSFTVLSNDATSIAVRPLSFSSAQEEGVPLPP